jgi:SAM-dependent methyltransferase
MLSNWRYRTELAIRRATPEQLKLFVRAARLIRPAPAGAPPIPQHLLDGCVMLSDRLAMLDRAPKGGMVCELGTLRGEFARDILARVGPAELHIVDVDLSNCAPDVKADPRVRLHEAMTTDFLAGCPPQMFDMVYVDADHSYAAVHADIAAARDKVKPGGLLAFNDFARIIRPGLGQFGVHQAVCEFMVAEGWPMAFFCMNGEALYDVALRRPAA